MRKTTKIYKDTPADYPLCLHDACPMADSCLRQLAIAVMQNWARS